ncbi:hypothetical protein CONCODRAFT_171147 [Conidiobolus coronatus NRRL 28638]|uniref:Uncharacterized protein n=1 Tax=Conidiobolus coronatus (strain ATCC 28846 / CBS 209.66 / NRRL 28638) TaxID=796925 RepID=A0A137NPB0_CONC2|nr:hypothetical protein CONCODRAFT_171147 [Conidiobolus coronatus NRRL 28638]|eukprot:KXN64577.1 hypothetical protein CONCODRAFT_171147 [Conidiobolus coronatus NRRL 28638]
MKMNRKNKEKPKGYNVYPLNKQPKKVYKCSLLNIDNTTCGLEFKYLSEFNRHQTFKYHHSNISNAKANQSPTKHSIFNINEADLSINEVNNSDLIDDTFNSYTESIAEDLNTNSYDPNNLSKQLYNSIQNVLEAINDNGEISKLSNNPYIYNHTLDGMLKSDLASIDSYPFPDITSLILHALLYSSKSNITKQLFRKILLTIELILKIHKNCIKNKREYKLPNVDSFYKLPKTLNKNLPKIHVTETKLKKGNEEKTIYMNLPSTIIQKLMADPIESKQIIMMPDYTHNQMINLNQCHKVKTDYHFIQISYNINNVYVYSGRYYLY